MPRWAAPAILSRVRTALGDALSCDLRALAVLRVALGLVMVYDGLERAVFSGKFTAFYTRFGLMRGSDLLSDALDDIWSGNYFSVLMLNEWPVWRGLCFLIEICAGSCLAVGWHAPLAALIGWVIVNSIQEANPLVNSGADSYLRCLLFWCMFLPLSAVWSLDHSLALKRPGGILPKSLSDPVLSGPELSTGRRPGMEFFSIATAGYVLQVALVYIQTARLKTGAAWRTDCTAVSLAMSLEAFRTPFAATIHSLLPSSFLSSITYAVLIAEYVFPLCLFHRRTRILGVVGIVGLHLGFLPFLRLQTFIWVGLAGSLGCLPTPLLDRYFSISYQSQHTAERIIKPLPRWGTWALSLLLLSVLLWNESNISGHEWVNPPQPFRQLVLNLRLEQQWRMFAPQPPSTQEWYFIDGLLRSGRHVELWRCMGRGYWTEDECLDLGMSDAHQKNTSLILSLRPDVYRAYSSHRWTKWVEGAFGRPLLMARTLQWACREWNKRHPEAEWLVEMTAWRIIERLPRDERAKTTPLLHHALERC